MQPVCGWSEGMRACFLDFLKCFFHRLFGGGVGDVGSFVIRNHVEMVEGKVGSSGGKG